VAPTTTPFQRPQTHTRHIQKEEHDRREGEHEEQWQYAHGLGDELHPQEEGARRDEEPEAHPPKMARPRRAHDVSVPDTNSPE